MYFIIALIIFIISLFVIYKKQIIDQYSDDIESILILLLAFVVSLGWFVTLPIVFLGLILYGLHNLIIFMVNRNEV